MAEERLIDDDKDRKYKIRINEDGEEELVIDDTPDEDESDIPVFQIPVYDEDDEDATSLSPQEFAEREKRKKEERKEDYPPPLEEPDFGDGFFGLPPTEEQVFAPKIQESKKEVKETESPLQPAPAAGTMTAQVAFGKFIRTLRKTSSNGVLRTLCDDLEAEDEGNTLALYTESKNIYASLSREEHKKTMAETFSLIGITDFAVKLKGEQVESRANGIEKLKQDFSDYPVEMK